MSRTACGSGCTRRRIRATGAFENLVSGTAVEVLERNPNYARVRLADGREGWVKATFLVDEKPAAARVLELEARDRRLRGRPPPRPRRRRRPPSTSSRAARRARGDDRLGRDRFKKRSSACKRENRAHEERLEAYRHALPMKWVIPAVVVVLVGGFFVGLWWLDALIRRRHGGFRVY